MGRQKQRVWPGHPYPLGATWDGSGTNFALFSAHAERVELCLFDREGRHELERIALPEYTNEVWHGYFPDLGPGQLYGYRAFGPYDPEEGHRFNHHKLLLDPYAKALSGALDWHDALFGYVVGDDKADLSFDKRDSAPYMPKCEIIDPSFDWSLDRPLARPWHESIIYELHVRGFTICHPGVAQGAGGSFRGLADKQVVGYLKELGVTAIELQPIHAFLHDRHLVENELRNYWGYNPIGFFALHPEFLGSGRIDEFKTFVRTMHESGIEVIMDVVYNHTAEGSHLGPTLSFRGIDNKSYYYLMEGEARYYNDFTGTGNALELRHPSVLRMVTDSLRYWIREMGVDGFRFDLATTLARVNGEFDEHASFLDSVAQDPLLSTVKLIAEPWDAGDAGYQLGRFPPGWAEWNDRYRDSVRKFWRGDPGQLPELASRLSGSSDIYDSRGRRPWASVNFVTAHDGFTLHDLVSYNEKHNEANQEGNRDGNEHNYSWNCGVEGPTDDPEVIQLREQQKRNLLATLMLSQGVPMLLAGDEFGHTQNGNNNAYCQDNEISWLDWTGIDAEGRALMAFVQSLIQLRRQHIVFHRHRFFHGKEIPGTKTKDITWLMPNGEEMDKKNWESETEKSVAVLISGEAGQYHLTEHGEREPDDTFLLVLNALAETVEFALPEVKHFSHQTVVIDTASKGEEGGIVEREVKSPFFAKPRSLALIKYVSEAG
ncbi:glycogen debranching protein GlgX [Marinobacter sp.]|uniref:glycogen debranching protein GlgX n=1 Tax=Marinobacter sp. TaxID=50741 RepID=UPI003A901559